MPPAPQVRMLAISGSLRTASSNGVLVKAVAGLPGDGVSVRVYEGLEELPHFNPDLDIEPAPPSVTRLRRLFGEADALLFSTPEYAHGIPGSLKNALDWLVSSGETEGKPFALVNTSPRATHAQAALKEVLLTMAAVYVPDACATVSLAGKTDHIAVLQDPELMATLRSAITALANTTRNLPTTQVQ